MGTLYIDRPGTQLTFERGALVIRRQDELPRAVPLGLVDRLVVVGNVQVSSGLLVRLAGNGSGIMMMPGRSSEFGSFVHGDGHGDIVRRINQYRISLDPGKKFLWAQRLVRLRIAGQRRMLGGALQQRPDCRLQLTKALDDLEKIRTSVRQAAPALATLRGLEGAATAAFYKGYRALFPDSLEFTARNRRPPRDPVNAVLSFGYTLAHGDALRAVITSGLDPAIGVYHEPTYGRDSLACDIAELARASVERMTWRMFADRLIDRDNFYRKGKAMRLKKSAHAAFFKCYEYAARGHRPLLSRASRALARECGKGVAGKREHGPASTGPLHG